MFLYVSPVHTLSMDYHEKYKYISDQLNVLKTEMDDLKNEERVTKNDVIHESNFKRGRQSKRRMLDQVRIVCCLLSGGGVPKSFH